VSALATIPSAPALRVRSLKVRRSPWTVNRSVIPIFARHPCHVLASVFGVFSLPRKLGNTMPSLAMLDVLPKRSYCPVVQAELFMPAAQLGSPSDFAIAIMLHVSWVRSMHLK